MDSFILSMSGPVCDIVTLSVDTVAMTPESLSVLDCVVVERTNACLRSSIVVALAIVTLSPLLVTVSSVSSHQQCIVQLAVALVVVDELLGIDSDAHDPLHSRWLIQSACVTSVNGDSARLIVSSTHGAGQVYQLAGAYANCLIAEIVTFGHAGVARLLAMGSTE